MKKSILDHTYDPEPFRRNPQTGSMHLSGKRSWKEVASISFKPILRKVYLRTTLMNSFTAREHLQEMKDCLSTLGEAFLKVFKAQSLRLSKTSSSPAMREKFWAHSINAR